MSQIVDQVSGAGMREKELQDTLRAALIAEADNEDWEISPDAVKALTEKYKGQEYPLFMDDINKGTTGNPHIEALQELLYGDDTTPESRARGFKDAGNDCFAEGQKRGHRFESAKMFYTQGIEQKCSDAMLNSVLHSNRGMTNLMTKDYVGCVDDCRSAIKFDSANHKAYYRAAKASYYLRLFKQANDFAVQGMSVLDANPPKDTQSDTTTAHSDSATAATTPTATATTQAAAGAAAINAAASTATATTTAAPNQAAVGASTTAAEVAVTRANDNAGDGGGVTEAPPTPPSEMEKHMALRRQYESLLKSCSDRLREQRSAPKQPAAAATEQRTAEDLLRKRGVQILPSEFDGMLGCLKERPWLDEEGGVHYSVMLLFDEYNISEFLADVDESSTILQHLEIVLPRDRTPDWDINRTYSFDNVEVYFDAGVPRMLWRCVDLDMTFEAVIGKVKKLAGFPVLHIMAQGAQAKQVFLSEYDAVVDVQ